MQGKGKDREKQDCYSCKHMTRQPGTALIRCSHPANAEALDDPLAEMQAIFAHVGRMGPILVKTKLTIEFKLHGFLMGWFNWPFFFDPVWLEYCDGFEEITGGEENERDRIQGLEDQE